MTLGRGPGSQSESTPTRGRANSWPHRAVRRTIGYWSWKTLRRNTHLYYPKTAIGENRAFASPLIRAPGASAVNENAAHGFGGGGKKVTATVPTPLCFHSDKPDIGFMDQSRSLKRPALVGAGSADEAADLAECRVGVGSDLRCKVMGWGHLRPLRCQALDAVHNQHLPLRSLSPPTKKRTSHSASAIMTEQDSQSSVCDHRRPLRL